MSYYASAHGTLIPKSEVPEEIVTMLHNAGLYVETSPDSGIWITFEFQNYNDQIEEIMPKLAPYIVSGNIEFSGDDGEHWRFCFDAGKVFYEDGEIHYKRRWEMN